MFKKELKYKIQDVRNYNLKPDILIHGSPCQSFSIAGYQKGADEGSKTESSLMWETIHIIEQMGNWKPQIVIWENVKNVLSKRMIKNFNKYLECLEEMGYTNSYKVLNTMNFGIPQDRNRVFVVSIMGNKYFDFDNLITKECKHIKHFLQPNSDVSDRYIVKQPSMINAIGKSGILKRLPIIEDHCFTISTRQDRAPNAGVIDIGNGQYRYLTELECWRLQGYSDEDFYAAEKANPTRKGSMNYALYKQAGNSISVPIFESIFRKLLLNQTK